MFRTITQLVVFVAVLGACSKVFAQSSSAELSGQVTDPSGAAVVNAEVRVVNGDTLVERTTKTNSAGFYHVPFLEPGKYQVYVKAQGFSVVVSRDLTLEVAQAAVFNAQLRMGQATETVTVEGRAPMVNTEDATVSTVIERQTIANMPLNGRSFQGLITLAPGVATVQAGSGSTGQFVVNGQRTDTNYFTVDGVSANVGAPLLGSLTSNGAGDTPTNSATGGYNNMVSIDALQEFRISTSNFAPEFGRLAGGQISLASRGGTNAFHGDIFDYLRNTVLDANDWFLNHAGTGGVPKPRGVVQQNDFGGVVGGPVIKDKLFFFFSYEGLRLQAPSPSVKLVPTQAARDLAAQANSGGVVGYMAQFLNAFPLPDANAPHANSACISFSTCTANYTASFPGKSVLDSTSGRIDYSLNKRMTLFGRYSHAPSSLAIDNSSDTIAFVDGDEVYTAGWAWAVNNSMSNDLHFNFTHTTLVKQQNPIRYKGSLSTIFPTGFAQPASAFLSDPGSMAIQISSITTDSLVLSPAQANNGNDQQNIIDTFGLVKGSHGLKFGVDYRELNPSFDQAAYNNNNQFAQNTTALTGFPSVPDVCPTATLPAGSGATVPGYICGQATLSNLQHNFVQHYRFRQYSFFGQDTWKVTKHLTLTYGGRWEINPPFEGTSNNPSFSVVSSSFNLANLTNVAVNPLGTPPYRTTWGNIAPRFGLAYQLSTDPKWGRVLRAGYGVFYDPAAQASVGSNPLNGRFNNQGAGAIAPLVQFPISAGSVSYVTPPAARLVLPYTNGGADALFDPNLKLPYVQQMNLSLEQQLGSHQTFTASYVGALGRRLIGNLQYPANSGNPAVFAQINPITGAVTTDQLIIVGNYSASDYHALQTKFQRQFSGGLAATASYTWSHSIDDASLSVGGTSTLPTAAQLTSGLPVSLLRGNSDFDIRHILALSLVYDLPAPSNRIARAFLGHWSVDPIYHYQTAVPIDILSGTSGSIGGTAYAERPNLIPGVPIYVYGSDCAAQYFALQGVNACPGGRALNLAPVSAAAAASAGCIAPGSGTTANAKGAFCTPAAVGGQAISGNFGRNVVRGFPLQELDLSVHRDFPIYESIRLRFQGDMFNVFNHPNFGPEGLTLNSATFGVTNVMANSSLGSQNTSGAGFNPIFQTGGPRNYQFSLKLFF